MIRSRSEWKRILATMTQQQMEQALKMASTSNDPAAYTNAINAIRYGRTNGNGPVPYGPAFTGNPGYAAPEGAGYPGAPEPQMNGFVDPYAGS